jgi:flagellar hook-basal body complex protein FliE
MSMGLPPISPIRWPQGPDPLRSVGGASGGSFDTVMKDALQTVSDTNAQANQRTERFLGGEDEEIHTVALAQQQAALTFDLFLQVRNKVVQAYQEVMRMQL